MRHCVSFRPLLLSALVFAAGCSPTAKTLAQTAPQLRGTIRAEDGTALAGVAVSLPGRDATTVTDEAGAYVLTANQGKLGDELAVLLVHPHYARLAARIRLDAVQQRQDFALRAHDVETEIALPAAQDAALVVPVTRADGGARLTIPAGSLALPDGTVATGPASLRLTYWHPNQALLTAPAPLTGTIGGDDAVVSLTTYGMADIELYQGEEKLQVVAGKTLTLTFVQPPNLAAAVAAFDATDVAAPRLWYVDEATGLWSEVGSLADGTLTVAKDGNGAEVVARLPHLSAWNIDGITQANACVTGKVVDSCGAPVKSRELTLWLLSGGQVAQYTLQTDSDGSYCGNLTGSAANGDTGARTATFRYFVSALRDPNASVCNPTGAASYSALCTVNRGEWCTGDDALANAPRKGARDFAAGLAACNTATAQVPLCGYCPGTDAPSGACLASLPTGTVRTGPMVAGACAALPDVVMPGCGNQVPGGGDICSMEGARHQADSCNTDADCCPNDALICTDGLCVPNKD